VSAWRGAAARAVGAAWELRRRAYAAGWARPHRVAARVVSLGNVAVGGTGKTTLALALAAAAAARGVGAAVVCRRYRPGPGGRGDEELLFEAALGAGRVYAGDSKWRLAARAAADGHAVVIVDDGFSHWALERDVDALLVDAHDPWAGGALLPAGRMREPHRAVQRAGWLVAAQARDAAHAAAALAAVAPWAPAARTAAGRHRLTGVCDLAGAAVAPRGPARLVTATGNPESAARTAREAGYDAVGVAAYRDHHWFTAAEAARELARARDDGAALLLTAKDAVRWPVADARVAVLRVAWEWLSGGDAFVACALAGGGDDA